MTLSTFLLTPEAGVRTDLDENEIKRVLESKQGLLWVDINEITEDDRGFLERVFKFHPLAVEDCISPLIHSPKVDDFGDHLFLILHGINYTVESEIVETAELDVFLGEHFVVSSHNSPLFSIEAIKHQIENDGHPMRRGADFLAYTIADALIDNVLPTIDQMREVAEDIEEETIRNPGQGTLEAILKLKRSTLRVHRVMSLQRELFNKLSRGDYRLIKEEAKIYYRDVYDHLVRIDDLNQTVRERMDNALATYLSSISNRQNEVMKTLTVVATIFLPLTLLAGIYGMNFKYMPELEWKWGYFVVLGVILSAITAVLWRFWVKGWVNWSKRRITNTLRVVIDPERLVGYGKPKKDRNR